MMQPMLAGALLWLLLLLAAAMVRVLRGPTDADRMVTAQLFGTIAVAVLAILGVGAGRPALLDVALVFALLAAVTAVAFVRGPVQEVGSDRR
jgi:multicomponent Na+:H+ antiporter subunit F